jgi:hypothetical protein
MKLLTMGSILLMSGALDRRILRHELPVHARAGSAVGYPFALGLMLVVDVALIIFFRSRKRW